MTAQRMPRTEAGRALRGLLFGTYVRKGFDADAAILAIEQEAATIDLERLKRAIEVAAGRSFDLRASAKDAEDIAAEYNRVASGVAA